MLLGVGFASCIHRDECACVVSVSDVLCNSKKDLQFETKDIEPLKCIFFLTKKHLSVYSKSHWINCHHNQNPITKMCITIKKMKKHIHVKYI
jgi:hypothetical protein